MIKEHDAPVKGFSNFDRSFQELKEATSLTRKEKAQKLATQIEMMARTKRGLTYLYDQIDDLLEADFFAETPWKDASKLVPSLVKGTLRAGGATTCYEIVSDLRMLAVARKKITIQNISPDDATKYLEEVIVNNLEFVFNELTEESREMMSKQDITKVQNLFDFLIDHSGFDSVKDRLAEEIKQICAQRPVVTRKVRRLIHLVKYQVDITPDTPADKLLRFYVDAVYHPSTHAAKCASAEEYQQLITKLSKDDLHKEAEEMAHFMKDTGLCTSFMSVLFLHGIEHDSTIIPKLLGLSENGKAEWLSYKETITRLMREIAGIHIYQCLYGLARMLEKNLFSRRAVRSGLNNLRLASIHPHAETRIMKSVVKPHSDVSAKQYLMSSIIRILGQPLGVGQGNNATCQSARGMSMWSQHSPAKLISMIITVATQNNLHYMFENRDLESIKLGKGLVDKLDYNLDAVSVILVPHLDKIYNEMMKMASGRTDDPHKWVNPAMYGHWIQLGFASCYNYLFQSIHDYKGFLRIFFAAYHTKYNSGRKIVYPNPVGIFITTNKGAMVGFHAVSLLRVKWDEHSQEVRAYFLNPNNEGRQDWGQGIQPTVYGHGEKAGESSLPFYQFAARIYAYHFNKLEVKQRISDVPEQEIDRVDKLARESWGRSYNWIETPKQW